jgi:uncharacterized membrane protein YccC
MHKDPQPFARSGELLVFVALPDEAERIRASLAAFSMAPAVQHATANQLSAVLREIAAAVNEGRAPGQLEAEWNGLASAAVDPSNPRTLLSALLGQMRAAYHTAKVPAIERDPAEPSGGSIRPVPHARDVFMTIGANLSLQSAACRHALRLSVAMAVATAIYRLAALPRGYWFPMTTLLVLKPEFRETFVTGVTRIIGTLAGAGLAALLVETLGSHPSMLTVMLIVFVWSGYALFRANHAAFTVCITGYIVVLLYLAGVPGPAAAKYRALDTILGGAFALAVYRVWPTWESSHVGDVLATLSRALARDATALGALALHAGLHQRPARARPELAELCDQMPRALDSVAAALGDGTLPDWQPPLTQTQLKVRTAVDPALADQTGMMVDSVNTAAGLLMPRGGQ